MNSLNLQTFTNKFLDACIVTSTPAKCYTKLGRQILPGGEKLRLHLNIFDLNETRFDISCYKETPRKTSVICVRLKDEKAYVDLEECANRLHISIKKLLKFKYRFHQLYQIKNDRLNQLNKITDHFEQVMQYYREGMLSADNLFSRDSNDVPSLTKSLLMKIIRSFHKELEHHTLPAHFFLRIDTMKILAFAGTDETYYLIDKSSKKELLSGNHGTVYRVHNISLGNFAVLKQSLTDLDEYKEPEDVRKFIYQQVENEITKLNLLKSLNITRAVQRAPYFSFENHDKKKICFVGHYYKFHDLLCLSENTPIDLRLTLLSKQFSLLIHTLSDLHQHNLVQTDIKMENIFVDTGYTLHFADIGGMQLNDDKAMYAEVYTPAYTPYNLLGKELQIDELKSIDVYQLGATLYATLTDEPPFQNRENEFDHPDFSLEFDGSVLCGICSSKAVNLLKKMCEPDENKRFTSKDASLYIENPDFSWFPE